MRIEYLTAHLWIDSRFVSPKIMEAKISLLKELTAYARSRCVRISLENLSEGAVDLRRAVEAIPDLMITLDIGHGQLLCRENRSFEILEILADHVGELHAHDNMGGTGPNDDLHLPLGQGVIDFGSILKKAVECGFDGPVILELAHHDLPESMAKLEHLWRRASMSSVSPTPL
jgi:sugar phosphate isomerase/epimerase